MKLSVNFRTLSPLYMGGADQRAELRPPSVKGVLRFWYRAVDPAFNEPADPTQQVGSSGNGATKEDLLFGGTRGEARQCPFFLRIESGTVREVRWDLNRVARRGSGRGAQARNGLSYLGFPLQMQASQVARSGSGNSQEIRTAIAPGQDFTVHCVLPGAPDESLRRALSASFWLLGHLGSMGTRSRRGFGSVGLLDWSVDEGEWPELSTLPILAKTAGPPEWAGALQQALAVFRDWFGSFPSTGKSGAPQHPHLGRAFRPVLIGTPFADSSGREGWEAALNHAGVLMQNFRQRRPPDYQQVKDHVVAASKRGGRFLQNAPERAAFGLPLTFRYRSVPRGRPVTLVPFDTASRQTFERHASLLHLRLALIGGRLYPLFLRLDGAVPGTHPPAAVCGSSRPLRSPLGNAMDAFLDSLKGS